MTDRATKKVCGPTWLYSWPTGRVTHTVILSLKSIYTVSNASPFVTQQIIFLNKLTTEKRRVSIDIRLEI